jgi:type I restriction enzyme R subunit
LELIELAKEINVAKKRAENSGLTADELAFYDALSFDEAAKGELSDDILKQIARDLTNSL